MTTTTGDMLLTDGGLWKNERLTPRDTCPSWHITDEYGANTGSSTIAHLRAMDRPALHKGCCDSAE